MLLLFINNSAQISVNKTSYNHLKWICWRWQPTALTLGRQKKEDHYKVKASVATQPDPVSLLSLLR